LLKLRKLYEVVGWSLEGSVFCLDCSSPEMKTEANPVFLQDCPEDEENSLHCDTCFCNLAD
jgi:hypothetical protein